MNRFMLTLVILAGLGAAAATQTAPDTVRDWRPSIVSVASPAGANSAQPQMTVSPRGILLSWVERAGTRATLKFAERTSGGWSPAGTAARGDDWFVNGTLTAHWLQKSGAETYAYDVRLSSRRTTDRRGHPRSRRITRASSVNTGSPRSSRYRGRDSASSGWTAGPWDPPKDTMRMAPQKGR